MEPSATTATTGIYCKQCGYDLRASKEAGRCPECGRVFSPDDPKTFRSRPLGEWKRALGRWAKRVAILLLVLGVLLGGTWGWYYWGWRQEQATLAETRGEPVFSGPTLLGGTPGHWLHDRHIPGSFVLERVRGIDLPETATDADLRPLPKLPELEGLAVQAPITDAGLAHLRPCPRLRELRIYGSRLTDGGLAVLRDLPHLEALTLNAAPITDAGLRHVAQLPGLKVLELRRMPLTDLAPLEKLRALERLDLGDTQVTDAGLVHLEKLPALRHLELQGTKVTPAGVARLKAALPGCAIRGP